MRREVPVAITFVVGLLYVLNNAIQVQIGSVTLAGVVRDLNNWVLIVAAFAMGLACVNLMKLHSENVAMRRPKWGHSLTLIVSFVVFALTGIFAITFRIPAFMWLNDKLFNNIQAPLGATMWAMVGFFICSSAYRAFRARNLEATLLLVSGILVMLGRAPIGEAVWSKFPAIGNWLLDIPNTAGQRAIMIGAAIGGFTTALRIIIGVDRAYLGQD
jgi:hypothetical protein